jgi:pyruvate formate lyase activating enzyme
VGIAIAKKLPLLSPLEGALREHTAPGVLFERLPGGIRCTACAHRCILNAGSRRAGACGVRFERDGELRVPFGYVARTHVRSVETNTVYHVLPGSSSLTFGMYGCDLRCPYCHNAQLSQALREGVSEERLEELAAAELVDRALAADCRVLCAAYNEPALAAEWVHEVFGLAKARGLVTAMITDGNATDDVLHYLRPVTDVYRVDLKAPREDQYHALGGRLSPVLDAIRRAKELRYWVEVVTLVVPAFNDDLRGLRFLATTLAEIDPGIPWHLNAFQPRYRMRDRPPTRAAALVSAAGAAYARGMQFVYAGNVDPFTTELASTRCPSCHEVLIERRGWRATRVPDDPSRCAKCGTTIPGLWDVTS